MKFLIRTLGCKMNLLDSTRVAAALRDAGHLEVSGAERADVVLVNTCTVTAPSARKSRHAVHTAQRESERVVVFGCGPKIDPGRWHVGPMPVEVFASEADLLASFGAVESLQHLPRGHRMRVPIAVQTGCDCACAYCIARVARGPHRSVRLELVVERVRAAEGLGAVEVVLTGINLGAWGCESTRCARQSRLPELLAALLERTGLQRLRLSSLGPQYLSPAFFEVFADPRICDHLHLSVQSGSASILRAMRRGHGVEAVTRAADAARRVRPEVAVTADFIVGFPGETDAQFEETVRFVREVGFAQLHVFPFSVREGTAAASMSEQIPFEVRKARAERLRAEGHRMREMFLRAQVGRPARVLLHRDGAGTTTNYIRVRVPGRLRGALADVVLERDLVE